MEGLGPKNFVYHKWPDKIVPFVNIICSRYGHFGLGVGHPRGMGGFNWSVG